MVIKCILSMLEAQSSPFVTHKKIALNRTKLLYTKK